MQPYRRDPNTWHKTFSVRPAPVLLLCHLTSVAVYFQIKYPPPVHTHTRTHARIRTHAHTNLKLSRITRSAVFRATLIKNIFSQRTHGNLFKYLDYPFKNCISYTRGKYLLSFIPESLKIRFVRGERVVVVTALCYKPENCGFETRWAEWLCFNLPNPSGCTRPWGSLSF
jgi:hypothetical protein